MTIITRSGILALGCCGIFAMTIAANSPDAVVAQRLVPDPILRRDDPLFTPNRRDIGDLSVSFRNLGREALPSIVSIDAISRPSRRCDGMALPRISGTGFVIDPAGYILTNSTLVHGAERVRVRFANGSEVFATGVRVDPRSNVAILDVPPLANLAGLPFGDSDLMHEGDWVVAVGQTPHHNPTVSAGIINTVVPGPGAARGEDFFQSDVAAFSGSSGGPLLNLNGQVIGIDSTNPHSLDEGGRSGMVAPANLVKWISRQLIDNGVVTRGYLGVTAQPLTPRLASHLSVPLGTGALISQVEPNTPASNAKLKPGDVITAIDGRLVGDTRQLLSLTERWVPGKSHRVEIVRGGERSTLTVVAARMPDQLNSGPATRILETASTNVKQTSNFTELGLNVRETTPELLRDAGIVGDAHGVMIDSVPPGSPAAASGLQRGMVIQKIGQQDVNNVAEFTSAQPPTVTSDGVLLYVHTRRGPRFIAVGADDLLVGP